MLEQESLNFEPEPIELHPNREFLGWDAPLLDSVTQWLLADERREHLANTLVVVPTSNSGRRLRMALSHGGGVLSPHVMPPSRLFEVDHAASRQESLWAWVCVIRQLNLEEYPNLFPNHEPGSTASFSVALALARQLMTLRDMLADGDASFQNAQYHSPETERWEELVRIEGQMLQCLGSWALRDSVLAKRDRAKSPELPVGVTRIVVACVPDPTLLASRALEFYLSASLPVTVLIHAPGSEKESFDSWGIPTVDRWTKRNIDIPDWKHRLHIVDSSTEAAEKSVSLLAEEKSTSDGTALVLCDPTFAPSLDKAFLDANWPLFNPDGKSLADTGLMAVLRAMKKLTTHEAPFDALRELVRIPGSELLFPEKTDRFWAAKQMDQLHLKHLPETVQDAQYLASDHQKNLLKSITQKLGELKTNKLSAVLRDWLSHWLEMTDSKVTESTEAHLAEALEAIERLESHGVSPEPQEAFEMLAESIKSARISSDRGDTVLDLQGWLEMSYDPAPHLILAGMHEECVPEGTTDDLFVPDSLREQLGLRDSNGRFARDAFLLQSAIASRSENGRVDALMARFNDAGEARKPSRLVMRQTGEALAEIVSHLFAESTSDQSTGGAWQRDWTLKIPDTPNPYAGESPIHLSPSAIKDYLNCPFRFFLKRIAKMDVYESGKREMNAMDFGNLCHGVVESFGRDADIRDSIDAYEIYESLSALLDQNMEYKYGKILNLPLMVQLESARERLRAFATVQAIERAKGWRIIETEFRVGPDHTPWALAGHPIKMTIDRIDQNDSTGEYRVWDYKTSGKAKKPEEHHQVTWREQENRPLLAPLIPASGRKKERRWADVQLPFYSAFVQQHFKTESLPQVGYINLPRAVTDVAFSPWFGFNEEVLNHAMSWAEAAVEKITAGVFDQAAVYPAKEREWDDFQQLAPDGLVHAFDLAKEV